jgi:hypothetical protein
MTHEKHCPYWRGGDPRTLSCGYCNAIRAAVAEERAACELICEQVRDSPVVCVDPPAEVVILERIRDRGKAATIREQP